jgi:phage shock protein PspC (stress-responsive transcriptional regulator)
MKKVISINFQGRVIPIEESAFEELKKYTESLQRYFAREEGKDEIINDIENRIAELFIERLKNNPAGCITEADIYSIVASIGRPEDFDGDISEATPGKQSAGPRPQETASSQPEPRGSLYRNENDKVLGGVCSGLAHYLKIDPTVVRMLFALITFGGFGSGVLLYIVLWIVLPARAMEFNVRRRLYRNPDEKVIGGVCSGISSYFNIGVWIPRVIFTLPFFIGILGNIFGNHWGRFDDFPDVVFSSFGGTLIVTYIILWIVVPFANTATEKLEMRGEKIDLESIKNTVQGEMQGVKGRAEKMGSDFKERASEWSEEVRERGQAFAAQAGPVARRAGSGLGHAIGVLFKAFFLFIAGIIVFALFIALMAMIFSGVGVFPLKKFMIDGFWQNTMAWGALILFLGVPIIASVIWLIRRISGVKSKNSYLGYAFGSLWIVGLVCAITLAGLVSRQFKRTGYVKEDVSIAQPLNNRMIVDATEVTGKYYGIVWFDDHENDFPALSANEDSMLLNSVKLKVAKSKDSNYHVYQVKFSRGNSPIAAEETATKIYFPVSQSDSVLYLPKGFAISQESKFRNQQVMVVVEVPVGKAIKIDRSISDYSWFNINSNRRGLQIDFDDNWDNTYSWSSNTWYVMTTDGLEEMDKEEPAKDEDKGELKIQKNKDGGEYRYRNKSDTIDIKIKNNDTTVNIKLNTDINAETPKEGQEESITESTLTKKSTKGNYGRALISVLDLMKVGTR